MAASTSTSISSSTIRAKSEFPIKVYAMLELAENLIEFSQAVTWLPHGRAFRIIDKVKFMNEVVPLFFNQNYKSLKVKFLIMKKTIQNL